MDAAEARRRRGARGPAALMARLRRWHVYLSVFVAPSLIFFALTGVLQTFRIPDRPDAPVLIQKLARVHKDDVFAVRPPRPVRPDRVGAGQGGESEAGPSKHGRHAHRPDADSAGPTAAGTAAVGSSMEGTAAPDALRARPKPKLSTEAAKWFFAAASVLIAATTLLGLWMALAYDRRERALTWGLLIAGVAIPVLILAL